MKEKITYTLIVLLFSLLVFAGSLFYLLNNFTVRGNADIKKKYYDIKFSNVTIDYDTDMTVKIDSDNSYENYLFMTKVGEKCNNINILNDILIINHNLDNNIFTLIENDLSLKVQLLPLAETMTNHFLL